MVNHHADRPKQNANWAVPMVDCPPAKVPNKAPQTIQLPLVPPVVKLRASLTLRPDHQLMASSRATVRTTPTRCVTDTI